MHRTEVDIHGQRREYVDDEPCPVIDFQEGRRKIQAACTKHEGVPFVDGTGLHCQHCYMIFSWV